jgi:hypothetical protein
VEAGTSLSEYESWREWWFQKCSLDTCAAPATNASGMGLVVSHGSRSSIAQLRPTPAYHRFVAPDIGCGEGAAYGLGAGAGRGCDTVVGVVRV